MKRTSAKSHTKDLISPNIKMIYNAVIKTGQISKFIFDKVS